MPITDSSSTWQVVVLVAGAVFLSLFVVEAMMQFTSTVMERRPRARGSGNAEDLDQLLARLVRLSENANESGYAWRIGRHPSGQLELAWQLVDPRWCARFGKVKYSSAFRGRLLPDPDRHELRVYESIRSASAFVGFDGWRPVYVRRLSYAGGSLVGRWAGVAYGIAPGFPPRILDAVGYDVNVDEANDAIAKAVRRAKWVFRPVTLPLYVSPVWLRFTRRVVPAPLRRIPRRRLWGVLYPVSYVVTIAYLLAITGAPLDTRNLLIIGLVSAGWWGVWGLIAWLLAGAPRFWKRRRGAT